jgi:Tfp pilus assembly protein PilO
VKGSSNKLILAMLAIAVLAGAFWVLLLSPKRQEASDLSKQVQQAKSSLVGHEAEVATAEAARQSFGADYGQLVVLGKAVPADSETASLLVQLQHIAERAHVSFESITLESEGGGEAAAPPTTSEAAAGGETGGAASPTEVAASTLPLGATIGPAGLAVMPYSLTFSGDFFHVADFIHGLDALVKTTNSRVAVDGRLITIDQFSLTPGGAGGELAGGGSAGSANPQLTASFSVTTYLTPPEQGITAGATPSGPATTVGTPASSVTGATP